MADYRASLRTFDWLFEFSDDADHIRKTRAKLAEMRRQQALLDPHGTIWTIIAPRGHGIPLPIVCERRSDTTVSPHTQGHITFKADGDANHYSMLTEDGRWWLALLMNGEQLTATQEAIWRRMAACWNACDGIITENLEQNIPIKELAKNYNALMAQRDELLVALDIAVTGWEHGKDISGPMASGRATLNKFFDTFTKTGVSI